MWILIITSFLNCTTVRNNVKIYPYPTIKDTIRLYEKDTLVNITNKSVILPFNVKLSQLTSRFELIIDSLQLISYPDGVYELYIMERHPNKKNTNKKDSYFVSLLDLYSLSASEATQTITVDITKQISNFERLRNDLKADIIIRFSGNKSASGNPSNNGGRLILKHYIIVEIK